MDANIVTRRQKRVDKTWDITTNLNPIIGDNVRSKDSIGFHVTPIWRVKGGRNYSYTTQLRCEKCSCKNMKQCSECKPTYAIWSGRTGIDCFVKSYKEEHA